MTLEEIRTILDLCHMTPAQSKENSWVYACPFAAVSGHRESVNRHPCFWISPAEHALAGAVWNCFSCHRSGTLLQFLDALESLLHQDVTEARKATRALLIGDPSALAAQIPPYEAHFEAKKAAQMTFPASWLRPYAGRVPRYLLDRGITKETAELFEVGHDKEERRVFYPVRDVQKRLVGAVGGLIDRNRPSARKYKNYWAKVCRKCRAPVQSYNGEMFCSLCGAIPLRQVVSGFKKSNVLYGIHVPRRPQHCTLVVVEGIVDTLRVYQALCKPSTVYPVSLLGSEVSDVQADMLVQYSRGDVIAFFDNDSAGRKATEDLRRRVHRRLKFWRVKYPEGSEGADPGSLPEDRIREMLQHPTLVFS
jgi:DNA primase